MLLLPHWSLKLPPKDPQTLPFRSLRLSRFARGRRHATRAKWNGRRRQSSTGCAQATQNSNRLWAGFGQRCRGAHDGFKLFTWARSGGFPWMSSDPGSCMAATAWCEVAKVEEGRFQWVPRKREKWLPYKVFVCFFPRCKYSVGTVQYLSRLEDFSQFRVNVSLFFEEFVVWLDLGPTLQVLPRPREGAADLLEALCHWQELEEVDFGRCYQIPAAAWQQLRGAKWPRLKKANFAACLARERNLVEGVH